MRLNSLATFNRGVDTLNSGETLVSRFLRLKTVDDITNALCDFHDIYSQKRSFFLAGWNPALRTAIAELAEGNDERMIRVTRVIHEMLDDGSEHSAYGYYDKDGVTEGIIEAGLAAYESHKRKTFKAKLAGDTNTYYDW